MTCWRLYPWFCCIALAMAFSSASGQAPEPPSPPMDFPARTSPVEFFRKLLAMKPEERDAALANRGVEQKRVLLAKVREYEQMPAEVRELRLRYTELRWHLLDLMKMPPQNRATRLTQVSEADRPMIEERLRRWDALDSDVRAAFLQHEGAVALFIERQTAPPDPATGPSMVPTRQKRLDEKLIRWQALPARQKQEMCDLFREFFDLGDKEKQQMLQKLSTAQRTETERAMQAFAKLPVDQREKRLDSLRKLVNMTEADRQRFMESAARWGSMTPEERESWRKSVRSLPPMPPLPPGLADKLRPTPPMPPGLPISNRATNTNQQAQAPRLSP